MSRGTKADGEIREERGGNGGKDSHRDRSKEGRDGWRETDEASGHARPAHPSVIENESVQEAS